MNRYEVKGSDGDGVNYLQSSDVEIAISKGLGNAKVRKMPDWWKRCYLAISISLTLMIGFFGWEISTARKRVEGGEEFREYVKFMSIELPPYKTKFVPDIEMAEEESKKAGFNFGPAAERFTVKDGRLERMDHHESHKQQRNVSKD